jgi:diadenosine tetraphosphate (Ap4A) HIT family hydrolase
MTWRLGHPRPRSARRCQAAGMTARTWPDDWARQMEGHGCPLCAGLGTGDDEHAIAVATLPDAEVGLQRRSRLPGYCVVVWRHGHVAEPTDLDPDAAAGYWRDVMDVGRAIRAELNPVKLNFLTLGNSVPHLHTHVVPRYLDDPAPGGPIPWDEMFTPEPTPPDELARVATALRRRLPGW